MGEIKFVSFSTEEKVCSPHAPMKREKTVDKDFNLLFFKMQLQGLKNRTQWKSTNLLLGASLEEIFVATLKLVKVVKTQTFQNVQEKMSKGLDHMHNSETS